MIHHLQTPLAIQFLGHLYDQMPEQELYMYNIDKIVKNKNVTGTKRTYRFSLYTRKTGYLQVVLCG